MRRFIDLISDALFLVAVLPFALACGWLASREERHDARLKAADGGMSPEEARRAFP